MTGKTKPPAARTMGTKEFAEVFGCSEWLVWRMVRDGTCPVRPIALGRKLVWPRAAVDRLLGVEFDGQPAPTTEVTHSPEGAPT